MTWFPHGTVGASGAQGSVVSVLDAFENLTTTASILELGDPLPFASGDVAAGSDRLFVAILMARAATVTLPSAMTLGGQAMTRIDSAVVVSGQDVGVDAWFLNDAGIVAAGLDPELDTTGLAASAGNFRSFVGSYAGVNQSTPVSDNDADAVIGPSLSAIASLTNDDGGRFVGAWIADKFQASDVDASWTNATEVLEDSASANAYFSLSEQATNGAGIAVSVTTSGLDLSFRNALIGFTLAPV